jgi:hypothetical protein
MMRRGAMRDNWGPCPYDRAGDGFFRRGGWNRSGRGARGQQFGPWGRNSERRPMMGRGPWNGANDQGSRPGRMGRGYSDRDFGPWSQRPMMGRGPWNGANDQGFRPGRMGRGYSDRNFGPRGLGPMMRRRPMNDDNRGWGFRSGGGGRGFQRGNAPVPDEQGQAQSLDKPNRDEQPTPAPRRGRDRGGRPGWRRGPAGPVQAPEGQDPNTETTPPPPPPPPSSDANSPAEGQPAGEGV